MAGAGVSQTQKGEIAYDRGAVKAVLESARKAGASALTAPDARKICEAYGIPVPGEGLATSAAEAAKLAEGMGFPVVLKIVSPDILHKTEAGGVIVDVRSAEGARAAYETIVANAKSYKADASIQGVQVQQMVRGNQEVIIGAVSDPVFGKLVAFGLGGVLVEVLKDVTFRLAPISGEEAMKMVDGIAAAEILRGVRGADPADRETLAAILRRVSDLVTDFPEIAEVDLNPVLARKDGATAVDARIVLDFNPPQRRQQFTQDEILTAMRRIFQPKAVAVIGASAENGKIGNSVVKNIVNGGYQGKVYPVNPKAEEILGLRCFKSIGDLPGDVDVAVFCIPAAAVPGALEELGAKGAAGVVMIPSGFAETGQVELQQQIVEIAKRHKLRILGPNIYGIYYLPEHLCATFCTPYDVRGGVALVSQSGGIGMAILGFARSTKMGVSAIVGVGNKSDVDEDDLLTFFEHDENTKCVAFHMEDLKDGKAFVEVARRVIKKKPIVVLKAGRTAFGVKAAASHTAALAGNDQVYEGVLQQAGVVRAPGLLDMLEYARALPILPTPKGENVVIITGAGGSGVLLSDAVAMNGMRLMDIPPDLDAAFRKFIPPFGASGNPIDITGGEPPSTYQNTIRLGLEDTRIHALILGYWHTIITPPMVFAKLCAEVVEELRKKGVDKPVVVSLAGDVEVEQASEYLFERGIPAYPYTTERPVQVLGAKYRWARAAGLL